MEIQDSFIKIKERTIPYVNLLGFVLEWDPQTGKAQNIVLILKSHHEIFTIEDSSQNIENFTQVLSKNIPVLEGYDQSFLEKVARKLKI